MDFRLKKQCRRNDPTKTRTVTQREVGVISSQPKPKAAKRKKASGGEPAAKPTPKPVARKVEYVCDHCKGSCPGGEGYDKAAVQAHEVCVVKGKACPKKQFWQCKNHDRVCKFWGYN